MYRARLWWGLGEAVPRLTTSFSISPFAIWRAAAVRLHSSGTW